MLTHLDSEQAFVRSDLDTEMYLRLSPGYGSILHTVARLNTSLYGLKQVSHAWF